MSQPPVFFVLPRCDAHYVFEGALEMIRTDSGFRAQSFQCKRLFVVFVDRVTNAPHQLNLRISCSRATRMATVTRAKTGFFGGFRKLKKAHLFASRPARRTRRATIDAGRLHSKHKTAIARSVA